MWSARGTLSLSPFPPPSHDPLKFNMATSLVQFAPFSTTISPSFWSSLASHKIDRLQLSDDLVRVRAHYSTGRKVLDRQTGEQVALPASMSVEGEALSDKYVLLIP